MVADVATRDRIDYVLDMVSQSWASLPEIEQAIDTWDRFRRLEFLSEWPTQYNLLDELRRVQVRMTPAQHVRYTELRALVERHQPVVDRLMV